MAVPDTKFGAYVTSLDAALSTTGLTFVAVDGSNVPFSVAANLIGGGGGGGGVWGTITGTLADQTDLQTALDAKAADGSFQAHLFATNPHGITKDDVGLSNALNTLHNFGAATAPTSGDDSNDGYSIGSRWIDTVADKEYVCVNDALNSAVWVETTQASGGGGGSSASGSAGVVQLSDGAGVLTSSAGLFFTTAQYTLHTPHLSLKKNTVSNPASPYALPFGTASSGDVIDVSKSDGDLVINPPSTIPTNGATHENYLYVRLKNTHSGDRSFTFNGFAGTDGVAPGGTVSAGQVLEVSVRYDSATGWRLIGEGDGTAYPTATVATGDIVVFHDIDDSNKLKQTTAGAIGALGGGGGGGSLTDLGIDRLSVEITTIGGNFRMAVASVNSTTGYPDQILAQTGVMSGGTAGVVEGALGSTATVTATVAGGLPRPPSGGWGVRLVTKTSGTVSPNASVINAALHHIDGNLFWVLIACESGAPTFRSQINNDPVCTALLAATTGLTSNPDEQANIASANNNIGNGGPYGDSAFPTDVSGFGWSLANLNTPALRFRRA